MVNRRVGLLVVMTSFYSVVGWQTTNATISEPYELTHQCGLDFENDIHRALLIPECGGCHSLDGAARQTGFILSKQSGYAGAVFNERVLFSYEQPLEIIDRMEGVGHSVGMITDRTDKRFQRLEYFIRSYLADQGKLDR